MGAMLFVALMGTALAAAGTLWHTAQMREKESDLLFIGNEYRRAIQTYYSSTPGPVKRYPRELADLVLDSRHPGVRRHLRKFYRDPVTGSPEWGLIRAEDGGIAGIYSLSEESPFKTSGFAKGDAAFEGKKRYSDWKFAYGVAPQAAN